jgi:hypothetical protein
VHPALRCLALGFGLGLASCQGSGDGANPNGPGGPGSPTGTGPGGSSTQTGAKPVTDIGASGARRLTRFEYDNTLQDLLGDASRSGSTLLPEDPHTPYDNDYTNQNPSGVLIAGVESLAQKAADRAMADPKARARLVPCTPSGADDAVCMRQFIVAFGRRALRRPLKDDEVGRFLALQSFGKETGDFYAGVGFVIQAMLQEPEFLYRVERGTPVGSDPHLLQIGSFETATRLSYLLLGTTPPDSLLDLAQSDKLKTPADRRSAALAFFGDARVTANVDRFHALWLGYLSLPFSPELTSAMQAETQALIERVIIDNNADYFDIFRSTDTYLNTVLATNYGLPAPGGGAGWVPYGASGRRGILSQGSVLSAFAKFNDTSFTQRGLYVRKRLMCQDIPPPPPNVDVNKPLTEGGPCKIDKQRAHSQAGCASCHSLMDPIGYGLENYDRMGRYRTHDDNAPACTIAGDGEVVGTGKFKGPTELSDLLLTSGTVQTCIVRQVYQYAMGRLPNDGDGPAVEQIVGGFEAGQNRFSELLLSVVASDSFTLFRQKE